MRDHPARLPDPHGGAHARDGYELLPGSPPYAWLRRWKASGQRRLTPAHTGCPEAGTDGFGVFLQAVSSHRDQTPGNLARTTAEVRGVDEVAHASIVGPYPGVSSWDLNIVNRHLGVTATPSQGNLGVCQLAGRRCDNLRDGRRTKHDLCLHRAVPSRLTVGAVVPPRFFVTVAQHLRVRRKLTIECSDESVEESAAWVLGSRATNSNGLVLQKDDRQYADQHTYEDNGHSQIRERSHAPLPLDMPFHRLFQ